ncbi:MAG: hypothetical protein ACKO2P_00120 [Planctomycetota bacterium]
MNSGVSDQSRQLRRQLLEHNGPDVCSRMEQSGVADPVGLIVEMTDPYGKQIAYAILENHGMQKPEIAERIAAFSRNAIPTFKAVMPFPRACDLLALTSETAIDNLRRPRPPAHYWIVVIAGYGNSYAQVPLQLPKQPPQSPAQSQP